MNLIMTLSLSLIVFINTAFAEVSLPRPDKLLEKASKSRVDTREVILDILQNIPEMRDPETFDSYFNILDELELIAQNNQLEEIYPDAVKTLGLHMVANGIRWLSLAKDPIEKTLSYHKWMDVSVAFSFQSNVELEAKTLETTLAKRFATNLDTLIQWIDKRFPNEAGLRNGYRDLISGYASRYLIRQDLTEEDRLFWLSKVYTPTGFSTALNSIQNEIITCSKEGKAKIHLYVQRLYVIHEKILLGISLQDIWLISQVGDISIQAILRMVDFREPFNNGEFSLLLKMMQPKHLQALVQQWVSVDRAPSDEYSEHYLQLSRVLLDELREKNLAKEAEDLMKFTARLAAPVMAKSKKLEGTYALVSSSGKKWTFTAILSKEATLYVALQNSEGLVNKSFFNVSYGIEDDTFVASEREADIDPLRNMTIKFKILGEGKIELVDLMAKPKEQILKGKKVENYPNYFLQSEKNPVDPSGTYEGTAYFGPKFKIKITLVVTGFNGYTIARLTDQKRNIIIDFNIGTRGVDGVLYLTTGRTRGNWIHMRGLLKNNEYRGFIINGGRGIAANEFVLKKVSN